MPADPVPIVNARVEQFVSDEVDYFTITGGTIDPTTGIPVPNTTTLVTEDGNNLTPLPIGAPVGLDQNAIMPLVNGQDFRIPVPVLSITSNGTTIINVTCRKPHGFSTGQIISVEGIVPPYGNYATGFYSITVTTATAFTYTIIPALPASSLLGSTTLMMTA